MPSSRHEALVEMFRRRPQLAAELLADVLGTALPAHETSRLEPGDCTVVTPSEYRADAVVVLAAGKEPVLAVIVEVQLGRDPDKRWTWPLYLATLRARLRCPAVALVLCLDRATARWCATPIELGPGTVMCAHVLGPDRVPVVTSADPIGGSAELTVLSALAHGGAPGRHEVLDALVAALATIDAERATLYSDLVHAVLPTAARRYLEELVKIGTSEYEYQSDFVRRFVFQGRVEGRVEGQVEARAQDVLAVLDARGVDVPPDVRDRILACTELEQLDTWLRRAATADVVDELFG
ncbi:MAG: hypothetical protein AB7J32_02075 [Pseudonocardia sp.]